MNNKKTIIISIIVLAAILCAICAHKRAFSLPKSSGNQWQAVFLTDGQVYFGKLENENLRFAKLSEVYYLKVSGALQQGTDAAGTLSEKSLNLIRLGGEAHGPEGEMFIAKDKILFIENLKNDSAVVQAIQNNLR
jgi:hypothetical protein